MSATTTCTSQPHRLRSGILTSALFTLLITTTASAATQIVLERGGRGDHSGEYTGVVDLAINPGFDGARVTVVVDGQTVAKGLRTPYHVIVDFGPSPVEHKITVTAVGPKGKRARWSETINRGMLPLGVTVKPVDVKAGIFDIIVTSPKDDPVTLVEVWENGEPIASATEPPYRFTVPDSVRASGFLQATAKTKSGDEAADFWSAAGHVHAAELQIRRVPIFVSVVDRNGRTQEDVDRSLFRILDNESEATIVEFGKAFDQPISIALLLDSSASMTYSIDHAAKAAAEFVEHALKPRDRASITAIQSVPRRKQALTDDHEAIARALDEISPQGQTALYDGVATAIRELRNEKNRRAIVILTDGGDTSSMWSYDDVEKLAREAAIPIYFIAYEAGAKSDARAIDRLRHLAAQTGGFVATATQQNLMAKYGEIEKDLRAQFAITYQVSDFGTSNEWRDVRVLISSPTLSARTIKGYFTP